MIKVFSDICYTLGASDIKVDFIDGAIYMSACGEKDGKPVSLELRIEDERPTALTLNSLKIDSEVKNGQLLVAHYFRELL